MMDHGNDGNSLTWRGALATAQEITVCETPTCGCCVGWDRHLYGNGFKVTARIMSNVSAIEDKFEKGKS